MVKDNNGTWPWPDEGGRTGGATPFELEAWSYDWKDGSFARTQFALVFNRFDGHLPLTSLPFYPFDLHPEYDAVRAKLIERGKQFRKICEAKEGSRLFEYSGKSILEKKGFSGMKHNDEVRSLYLGLLDVETNGVDPFTGYGSRRPIFQFISTVGFRQASWTWAGAGYRSCCFACQIFRCENLISHRRGSKTAPALTPTPGPEQGHGGLRIVFSIRGDRRAKW